MRFLKNKESGQALIMALILLGLGSLLVVPTLNLAGVSLKYHHVIEGNTLETYAADSGVEYALCKLGNNPGEFGAETLPSEVNDRTVNVTVQYCLDNIYKITSTATSDSGSNTTIESYVSIVIFLFERAITALDGDITVSGNSLVTSSDSGAGDIYANGNINISGNATIDGNATATGEINTSSGSTIMGEQEGSSEPLVFTEIDTSIYLKEADQGEWIEGDLHISGDDYYDLGPAHITGNLTISNNRTVRLTGTVWVDGTITMSGNTNIEGAEAVVAVGDIQLTGDTKLDPGDIPLIISIDGNITTIGNSWISAILYAPNGNITLSGNSKVYGAVVGKSVSTTGNNTVEYPQGLGVTTDLPGSGGVNILSYTIQK